jgi:hypothetical protein
MKYKLFALLVFLALPAVAAAPRTFVSTCDVQMQIRDGRDAEGLAISGQRAELILPCVTKTELAKIIEAFGKGDAERKDRALDALRRAKQIKLMLTPEVATQEKE